MTPAGRLEGGPTGQDDVSKTDNTDLECEIRDQFVYNADPSS